MVAHLEIVVFNKVMSVRVKLRCPSCNKIFSMALEYLRSEIMEFQCSTCHSKFLADPENIDSENILSTYLPGQENQQEAQVNVVEKAKCPSCGAEKSPDLSECQSCGIVFAKFENSQQTSGVKAVSSSVELINLWQSLTQDYSNESLHKNFIQSALQQKNLAFASQQYRKLLEVNPNDEMALKMRDKIINIATISFVPPKREAFADRGRKLFYFLLLVGFVAILLGEFSSKQIITYLGFGILVVSLVVRFLGRK